MQVLSIDLETYSDLPLKEVGSSAYTAHPSFQILLLAYAFGEEAVQVVDLARGEPIPTRLLEALLSDSVLKAAYNATFERAALGKHLGVPMPPHQWRCTAVLARVHGLPHGLEGVCEVLGLTQTEGKEKSGKALITHFCKPHQRGEKGMVRYTPEAYPKEWEDFKAYAKQDVIAERAVRKRLEEKPLSPNEQKLWELDQKINERGIKIDEKLVQSILTYDQVYKQNLLEEAKRLTGLANPKSPRQLLGWLESQGIKVESLAAKVVTALLTEATGELRRVLEIRQILSKTSIRKYEAMARIKEKDGRMRGTLQFYGASRSGRWAGKLVQLHNLPQNNLPDLACARVLAREGEFETLDLLFGESAFVFSQLIRTALIPKEGCRLIVCDFSAIEARIVAWLADEKWRLKVFEGTGKIYEASASQMFGIPEASISKGSTYRQKGKVAELACGYGGGIKALENMGGKEMGLTETEMSEIISQWRKANPQIVRLWKTCESAAKEALDTGWPVAVAKGLTMVYEKGVLWVNLPSGRALAYQDPQLEKGRFTYKGIHPESKKWVTLTTYGGKWVENIVQAVARDCLAVAMQRLEKAGYPLVMHIHDEVVIEKPKREGSLEEVRQIMGTPIEWAPGLHLESEGFEALFYQKD